MKKLILAAASVFVLSACQTTMPPYQASVVQGAAGYSSAPASDGRYSVVYTGQARMSRAQVAEYALLRAAEMTLESGQEWFAVIDTSTRKVALVAPGEGDLTGRGELGQGSASAGSGAPAPASSGPGIGDAQVNLGPSTGGFGGGDVPYQVLERWKPPEGFQTTITIQMGSGDEARFTGLTSEPDIYAARDVADEIRGKMAQ